MKKLFYILLMMFYFVMSAQKRDSVPNFDSEYFLDKNGDTLTVEIAEVPIYPKHKFKSRIDKNYYYWFRKKVFKAYPYAVMAAQRIDTLNVRLSKIKSKRKRRKYVKIVQNYIENNFTDQLKKLTKTEGRVLIKLIHRQTGKTTYQNIRQLRSGMKAFLYNTQANLFGISLKHKYNPIQNNEDFLIEDVLQRAYLSEHLEFQDSKLNFDSHKVITSKKGEVDVEKYKQMFAKRNKARKKKK